MDYNIFIKHINNLDDYFKKYLDDVINVIKSKEDGGFEEPLKYYLASKLKNELEKSNYCIYTGNNPKDDTLRKIIKKGEKPDLIIADNSSGEIHIIEIKTNINNDFLYSSLLAEGGIEKNYNDKKGDFWKQKERLENSLSKNINCNCYLLCFYKECIAPKKPNKWVGYYDCLIKSGQLKECIIDRLFYEHDDIKIKYYLLKVLNSNNSKNIDNE